MTDVRFTRVLPGRHLVGRGAGKNAKATLSHPPGDSGGMFALSRFTAWRPRNVTKSSHLKIVTLLSPKYKRKG